MYDKETQRIYTERSRELLDHPDQMDDQAQMELLYNILPYHEWRYYVLDNPVISDYEYDQLYKRLEKLEEKYPDQVRPDSPTKRVSSDLTSDFPEVPHMKPMLSLDNSYNEEDLFDFDRQVKKLCDLAGDEEVEYTAELKYDGGTIALLYENDQFVRAATRGNGEVGEEITNNARVIRSIPLRAPFSDIGIQKAELRGEAVIRKDRFVEMNSAREEEGLELFANPRNTATGGLRMKDPQAVEQRNLDAIMFQLGYGVDESGNDALGRLGTHNAILDALEKLGFKVPREERKLCRNIREVVEFCEMWEDKRDSYEYEIDGMVIKVNDLEMQDKCGATSHHPRWAIAYKFKAKQATTKLLSVEYQVGKVGSITPVAKLMPVQLAGVTVSSVSLHNEDFITGKDIRIGDTVLVERAGDVIPYIVKSMADLRDGSEKKIDFPRECPVCESKLVRPEGEAAWRCVNESCQAQVLQRMIYHVSKDAMDIDGLGRSIIERFYELGWLRSIADLYRLDYEKISELEGFGEKSAANIRKSVEDAKQRPIYRLLASLSIHHLGKRASKLIAERVGHVMELKDWTEEEYVNIKDIGPVVASNVIAFFQNENNVRLLKEMEALGVNMEQTEKDKPLETPDEGPLVGKTILFTGSLQQMTRKEAKTMAEEAGARAISAVSGNLDILVVGENAGSKLKKAQSLGTVEIIDEASFLDLVSKS